MVCLSRSILALAIIGMAAGDVSAAATDLMVADFDSGHKPNNIGSDFGCWIKDPGDPMQGCNESFDRGAKGNALRIIYSVDSDKPAFGGLWMRLQNLDAAKFDTLALRVKGDAGMGYTKVFKVELKDAMDVSSHFYVRGVTDQWQDITIPVKDFEGMANTRKLKGLVLVIEDTTATAKRGVIYIDDVRLTKTGS